MTKRIVAALVGLIAVFAGLIAVSWVIEGLQDITNPAVPLRLTILGEFITCLMAFGSLTISAQLLCFSISGRSSRSTSWVKPVLLGIGSFFPGFLFSLPLTILWARLTWPGDGQSYLAAMELSCYVGVAATIVCTVALLKKRSAQHTL